MINLRLATRRSPLALAQARLVEELLVGRGVRTQLVEVTTSGDQNLDSPLSQLGGQGVFVVEVQRCVLRGDADVAIHSAKDLPSVTPDGLVIASVPERRDPADALVGRSLAGLGPGATVATGSARRRALLLERRPDLSVVELRGNMATRLARAGHDGVDAVVAAIAALERLEWSDRVAERLDPSWFVPQVGQGTLALEAREDDTTTREILAMITKKHLEQTLFAERAFLRELGVGCSVPVAAHATLDNNAITLHAVMAANDGHVVLRDSLRGDDPEVVGTTLARRLRDERGGSQLPGWSPA